VECAGAGHNSSHTTSHPYGECLAGTPEAIAAALGKFPQAGYTPLVLVPYSNSPDAVAACTPIIEAFDAHRQIINPGLPLLCCFGDAAHELAVLSGDFVKRLGVCPRKTIGFDRGYVGIG
jgi:hypothetical protein